MNWSWLSFVVGILVGWLIEWLIDYIFWRRKHRDQEAEIADLQQQIKKAWDAQREAEQQAAQCAEQLDACREDLTACRDNLAACRDDLTAARDDLAAAEASADALSARAAAVAIPLDLEEEAPKEQEIDPAEFSPEEGTESAIAAGEFPVDEIVAADTRLASVPLETKAEPEPAPEAEDVDPSEFSAEEADLPTEGEAEDEAVTRAGAVIPIPLTGGGDEQEPAPEPQDLTQIEGIGPKTAALLKEAGIVNFAQLADTPVEKLDEILDAAGSRYRMIKPKTWPLQARLADEGRWDELEVLQNCILNGEIVEHDLTKIEGVGPKIQGLLYEAELVNYNQVAAAPVDRLQGVLDDAGPRYRMADPSTWPEQAALAAAGKWDELKTLQDRLSGGRLADEPEDE